MLGKTYFITLISLATFVQAAPTPQLSGVTGLLAPVTGILGGAGGGAPAGGEAPADRRQLGNTAVGTGPFNAGLGQGNPVLDLIQGGNPLAALTPPAPTPDTTNEGEAAPARRQLGGLSAATGFLGAVPGLGGLLGAPQPAPAAAPAPDAEADPAAEARDVKDPALWKRQLGGLTGILGVLSPPPAPAPAAAPAEEDP